MGIITSMLDQDFYKFTMQQVVFKKFPDVEVEYTFKNRTKGITLLSKEYTDKVLSEIYEMCKLRFRIEDIRYLKSLGLFSKGYLEYLSRFRFDDENVIIPDNNKLIIKIKGTWLNTILWEVPLLAIISELHSNSVSYSTYEEKTLGEQKLSNKINLLHKYNISTLENNPLIFADFGTRRRYSKDNQDRLVKYLKEKGLPFNFVGTSNVYLAKKYNVKPIGTMAHEFIQAFQQLEGCQPIHSQKCAFQTWADIYRGDLGIALSDTLGSDMFFKDFDMYFAKLFDGCRHDSGNPDVWCDRLIEHYVSMGIDPLTKTAVFSDGLTFPEMIRLHKKYSNMINVSFGVGTNLTNDCGIKPLQIVLKMTKCNGRPVAKISDNPAKGMCEDKEFVKYLEREIQ